MRSVFHRPISQALKFYPNPSTKFLSSPAHTLPPQTYTYINRETGRQRDKQRERERERERGCSTDRLVPCVDVVSDTGDYRPREQGLVTVRSPKKL